MTNPTSRFDSETDTVYSRAGTNTEPFSFNDAVARVFPDMIRRSVPGYTTIVPMIGLIAARFARPGTVCYDLGCSLGAVTLAMRHSIPHTDGRIIAVDNAESMIERCQHYIALDDGQLPVALQCADIRSIDYQPASVVALNFTLQFLPPGDRDALLSRLCRALTPGGALVLSEKVAFDDPAEQALLEDLHLDFKRAQGYSEMEISRKRNALEEVLVPESVAAHRRRLEKAGFKQVTLWHQSLNFVSIIAIAPEETA